MNNYDFIKNIGEEKFIQLVSRGIIPINIMDYVSIYEAYLEDRKNNKKMVSITYCADKFNLSDRTIHRVVKFMNK